MDVLPKPVDEPEPKENVDDAAGLLNKPLPKAGAADVIAPKPSDLFPSRLLWWNERTQYQSHGKDWGWSKMVDWWIPNVNLLQ